MKLSNKNYNEHQTHCDFYKCGRRVSLTCHPCRCDKMFCHKHWFPEHHKCTFDYKCFEREFLKNRNQKCIGEKVVKI